MFRKRKKPPTIHSTLVTGGRFKRSSTSLSLSEPRQVKCRPTVMEIQLPGNVPVTMMMNKILRAQVVPMIKGCRKLLKAGMKLETHFYALQLKCSAFQSELLSRYTKEVYYYQLFHICRGKQCSKCQSEEATVYCQDCGPFVYLCQPCTVLIHTDPLFLGNAFHLPQLWTAVQ